MTRLIATPEHIKAIIRDYAPWQAEKPQFRPDLACQAFDSEADSTTIKLHAADSEAPATITPAEQLQIQQAVARRAKTSSANYQTIYRAIKVRFQIPRYTELPTRQFAECLKFIDAVDLKVPEAKTAAAPCENQFTPEELAASPEKPPKGYAYQVSAKFLDDQRTFVYCWRYLFRRELELFEEFLYRTESPRAARFHEAVNNLNLMRTEDQLRRLGFPMDGLPCYQHYVRRLATAHQR